MRPPGVFIHQNALCESKTVGSGSRIWAFAHVLPGARVGADCNICDGAYVEGQVRIGDRVTVKNQVMIFDGVDIADDVFLGPGVTFTNDLRPRAFIKREGEALLGTWVHRGATLGARSTVVCGVTIGEYAFAGAGSVITRDVAAHAFVVGSPARQVGWVCICGARLADDLVCRVCDRRFRGAAGTIEVAGDHASESA
nr:acyltransferase [Microlunatus soli]